MEELLQSIIQKIRKYKDTGEWDWSILVDAAKFAALVWDVVQRPLVFGIHPVDARVANLAAELVSDLGGAEQTEGAIGTSILIIVLKLLLNKILDKLSESGLPAEVVEWIRKAIEEILNR